MESDIIRSEIDKTLLRISYRLQLIEQRARDTARAALVWSAVTVTAAGVIAVVAFWGYRRRAASRRHRREQSHTAGREPLRFGRVGLARGSAPPESTP